MAGAAVLAAPVNTEVKEASAAATAAEAEEVSSDYPPLQQQWIQWQQQSFKELKWQYGREEQVHGRKFLPGEESLKDLMFCRAQIQLCQR